VTARVLTGSPYLATRALLVGALATTAAVALAILVAWPLAGVVVVGSLDARVLGMPVAALGRTFALVLVSTALTVSLATAVAYAALRHAAPGAALAHRTLMLGLVLPPLVPALGALTLAGGRRGFFTLVAAQVVAFLPYAYLAAGHALAAVHPDREDAAESLGAARLRILTRVTLPALVPGLGIAVLAVALLAVGDFVNPAITAGPYMVLTSAVFGSIDVFVGASTAVWLLVPSLALAALGRWRAGAIVAMPAARLRRYRPAPAAVAVPLAIVAAAVTTAWLAASTAVLAGAAVTVSEHGIAALTRAFGGSFIVSLAFAALAAVTATVLALVVAGLVVRKVRGAALLAHASLIPSAVPGLVLGLGLLIAYRPGLSESAVCLVALTAAALPIAVAAALATLRGLDANVTTVAASLGADRRHAFSRILAPLLTPVTVSILVAVFVRALGAVSVVALLRGPGPGLASVAALDTALAGKPDAACVPVVALSLVVLVVVGLRRTLPGREHASVWFL
jgi:iron(III) transport system permease protein